ncbi:TetR/AcrR family transcriptional regulator [Mycobacterium seoulense]|uniref:TetR family transcriptional regulator n=1 Tax=Mycobacterium seoulense TaxID=386911 RepID=A0A7I7P681_9MYCO|nr:TetR/AcrR family transcriptional regulator [Mycobacterium seoulense]BBY04377.1 TetR family transcriptional regulator [Mycobacterium seoulense]
MSLRERKRTQTRRELISAAMSLFEEKGYEETTVAEIASTAGVSTKTFFNYFASKDEVLFPHLSRRVSAAVALIEQRAPDDGMADVLVAAMQHMLADALTEEVHGGLAAVRLPMIVSVPAVQAATLHRYFLAETQLARALHRAYSDALDPAAAAAVIGSVMGAAIAAALACLQDEGTAEQLRAAVESAIDIAINGVRDLPTGSRPAIRAARPRARGRTAD